MKPVIIDYSMLEIRCKMQPEEFQEPSYGEYVPLIRKGYDTYSSFYDAKTKTTTKTPKHVPDEETFYVFQDNGASVLAVAHLDTVISPASNWTFERAVLGSNRNKQTMVFNAQLDDRLGVYILLDLLPTFLGDKAYDILLTTDEEVSASTAEDFIAPTGKKYNWIFQFDRRGTGAVLYDYDEPAWRATVGEFLRVDIGSFSDICKLYDLGVKGMNVGTGYHDEHQDLCYMVEEEVVDQVAKFISFYRRHKDTQFPHDPSTTRHKLFGWRDDDWNDNDWADYNYRKGGYWDGTKWVTDSTSVSGTTSPNGASRWPLVNPANTSTNIHGAPRHSGIIKKGNLLDPDDEENIDNDYNDRDFVDRNELRMLAAVSKSMSNYDTDGNYVTQDIFIRSEAYYGDAWDWMELPAVYKEDCLVKYITSPDNGIPSTAVSIYTNRVTGAKAVYCKACSLAHDVVETYWTPDCTPICVDCVSVLPAGTEINTTMPDIITSEIQQAWEVPLTNFQVQWLSEGGAVRMQHDKNIRSFVGVDTHIKRCYCDLCGEGEWADKLVNFSNPVLDSTTSAEVCRDCFEQYQSQEGI